MRILIIGGTRFLGKHSALIARERGHAVTLFNRGQTAPGALPDVETITGDRLKDMDRLASRTWDAVIDTCAYHPRSVEMAAGKLRDRIARYLLVSTISVYNLATPHITEGSARLPLPAPHEVAAIDPAAALVPQFYGPLKTLCEEAALAGFGAARTLIVRPGLIVGPDDPTDRFTYWPLRIDAGGEILAPDAPGHLVQYIDVRDLATWMVHALETGASGAFNVSGQQSTLGEVIAAAQSAAARPSTIVWVDEDFLSHEGVGPWMELPLWIPRSDSGSAGIINVDVRAAMAQNLTFRPIDATVRDTLCWARTHRTLEGLGAGLKAERESELIARWTTNRAPRVGP